MIYSWQKQQWQQLWQSKQRQRLSHALLLTGIKGLGKTDFADQFSRALLCEQLSQNNEACGECHPCKLVIGKSHPNVLWVTPEKVGAAIKVDQIREVGNFIAQSALKGEYKIVIIAKADDMNINAANALLKTLEEPSSHSLLILISDQLERLPATIISRCQRVIFPRPAREEALAWLQNELTQTSNTELLLQIAEGAPLTALQLEQEEMILARKTLFDILSTLEFSQFDPIKSAAALQEMDVLHFLDFNLSFISDLVRLQLNAKQDVIVNKDYLQTLQNLRERNSSTANVKLLNEILHLRKQVCIGINFNKQLLMENVLVKWMG